ncbi:MAG TPA: LytTR family DNA-binding domain-containing protein [Chitinophagaceae bacterium]
MINALIIDDEPRNIDVLNKLVSDFCEGILITGIALSVDEAIRLIREKKPDLVFLDIEMPGKNAFDLIDLLSPVSFEIIFVTAFEQYAIKAFRYSAIDYILKPVNIKELREALERARQRLQEKSINNRLENFYAIIKKKDIKIAIQLNDGYCFHNYTDIIYCSADGAYTHIYLSNGNKIISSNSLKHFTELLPEEIFCRIHNSHLINLDYAVKYSGNRSGIIEMSNGLILEVSQRKKDELLNRFKK